VGYDVSFHPLDVDLLESRILPFIRGELEIDDLVDRAARIARIRFRANAWGLGLLKLIKEGGRPPGLFDRLRGRDPLT
jgi:hypothetical protein